MCHDDFLLDFYIEAFIVKLRKYWQFKTTSGCFIEEDTVGERILE